MFDGAYAGLQAGMASASYSLPNWLRIININGQPQGRMETVFQIEKCLAKSPAGLPISFAKAILIFSSSNTGPLMPLDSAQIRHRNFMKLFNDFINKHPDEPRRGMLKAFAHRLQLSERYLSHIKCNRKNIGANLARTIEKRLRLAHGWMDREHDPHTMPLDDQEKIFIATALAFFRACPAEARDSLMHYFQQQFTDTE